MAFHSTNEGGIMSRVSVRLAAIGLALFLVGRGDGPISSAWAGEHHRPGVSHGPASVSHGTLEVGDASPPTVALTVHKDPKAGWNLQVQVENFRFAPERASTTHVPGEGHAHLFIDGKKITRLYGEWYHIPLLTPGTHKITVTLNANSHEDLTVKGKVISATQDVRVPSQ
jgi:hypothetical protein